MIEYGQTELRFHALRNALYHTARRRSLERLHRAASMLVILLGTGVVIDSVTVIGIEKVWLGIATAVVGTAQLVLDFAGRARTHELLQSRYYELLSEIVAVPEPSEQQISQWNGRLIRIYGDEPPPDPVREADAFNEAATALGAPSGERLVVPLLARIASLLCLPLPGMHFETVDEQTRPSAK